MNAYHVCGGLFALWAVVLFILGTTREDFPSTAGAQRMVAAISILLALATIGTAVYTGATEDDDESGGGDQAAVLPL